MSSNLFGVYSYLREKYINLKVLYNKPISYLRTLISNSDREDIIFVCKETSSADLSEYVPPKNYLDKSQDSEDPNLTGSPLKDTCNMESFDLSLEGFTKTPWGVNEENYRGITTELAKNLLSDFELQKLGKQCTGSVWVLCDSSNSERMVLLALNFREKQISRSKVCYKGLLSPKKVEFAEISRIHNSSIHGSSETQTNVENSFQIKPNMVIKLSSNLEGNSLNNYRNTEAFLKQTVNVKTASSVADDFWLYLDLLSAIKEYIVEYKQRPGICEPIYKCGRGIELDELFEKITLAMTELACFYDTYEIDQSCEIEEVVKRVMLREPVDITDKLWTILRCCSCYKDLQQAFRFVFQCAATCNILNIPKNQNRVAEIIREVQEQRLAIPNLSGSEPLELLLEIGIEKLTKDYESIFVESKICGLNDLREHLVYNDVNKSEKLGRKSFYGGNLSDARKTVLSKNVSNEGIGLQNTNFNEKEVDFKLNKLAQIQLALEHLILIQDNLNLENAHSQIFKELMARKLRPLHEVISEIYDEIQIPIAVGEISYELENKYPDRKKIVMNSKNKFKELQSTFYYSTENIFPSSCQTEESLISETVYHWWHVLKIKT